LEKVQEKICSKCKVLKCFTEFSPAPSKKSGVSTYCKPCANERQRFRHKNNINGYRDKNNHRSRFNAYKRRYGLEDEVINKLMTDRVGECVICKTTSALIVDHCHATNIVRGLICSACNVMLGHGKENIDTFKAAIKYLKDYS
jgi:hypothetical protein